jgi:kojibiose phosphorylase
MLRERDSTVWRALRSRLDLRQHEIRRWTAVRDGLVDGFDDGSRLYEQFNGFFAMEDVSAAELGQRPFAGDVVLGPERARRAQVVKQADVLMLIHMLGELMSDDVAAANYSYYEPRTSHGSSLSAPIHAAVAARLGRLDEALSYLRMAAAVDLGNGMGNAAQGVHMAAMGGLWQAAVMGFGGVRPGGAVLRLDPKPPDAWKGFEFPLRWRGTRLEVAVRGDRLVIKVDGSVELALGADSSQRLGPGRYLAERGQNGWSSLRAAP